MPSRALVHARSQSSSSTTMLFSGSVVARPRIIGRGSNWIEFPFASTGTVKCKLPLSASAPRPIHHCLDQMRNHANTVLRNVSATLSPLASASRPRAMTVKVSGNWLTSFESSQIFVKAALPSSKSFGNTDRRRIGRLGTRGKIFEILACVNWGIGRQVASARRFGLSTTKSKFSFLHRNTGKSFPLVNI